MVPAMNDFLRGVVTCYWHDLAKMPSKDFWEAQYFDWYRGNRGASMHDVTCYVMQKLEAGEFLGPGHQ
jgi:hypothetical protein